MSESIRELRERLGLTQRALAKRLGVTYVTVARWETAGISPSPLALQQLAALEAPATPQLTSAERRTLRLMANLAIRWESSLAGSCPEAATRRQCKRNIERFEALVRKLGVKL